MIWPLNKFAEWAERLGRESALNADEKLELVRQKIAVKNAQSAEQTLTTMKKIVIFCLVNGVAWVWCSYILAFTGHDTIAESLSQVALAEIIGVTLTYAIKSVLENLSKNNNWPDKAPSNDPQDFTFEGSVGYNNEEDYTDGPAVEEAGESVDC